jgi:hypothetical protein
MKGKITIKFKFEKDKPYEFMKTVNVEGLTAVHIASTIGSLIDILKDNTPVEEQDMVIKMLSETFKVEETFVNPIKIVTRGDA